MVHERVNSIVIAPAKSGKERRRRIAVTMIDQTNREPSAVLTSEMSVIFVDLWQIFPQTKKKVSNV
jgi:hypothetical protein